MIRLPYGQKNPPVLCARIDIFLVNSARPTHARGVPLLVIVRDTVTCGGKKAFIINTNSSPLLFMGTTLLPTGMIMLYLLSANWIMHSFVWANWLWAQLFAEEQFVQINSHVFGLHKWVWTKRYDLRLVGRDFSRPFSWHWTNQFFGAAAGVK